MRSSGQSLPLLDSSWPCHWPGRPFYGAIYVKKVLLRSAQIEVTVSRLRRCTAPVPSPVSLAVFKLSAPLGLSVASFFALGQRGLVQHDTQRGDHGINVTGHHSQRLHQMIQELRQSAKSQLIELTAEELIQRGVENRFMRRRAGKQRH
jgi:hypothetical protein